MTHIPQPGQAAAEQLPVENPYEFLDRPPPPRPRYDLVGAHNAIVRDVVWLLESVDDIRKDPIKEIADGALDVLESNLEHFLGQFVNGDPFACDLRERFLATEGPGDED